MSLTLTSTYSAVGPNITSSFLGSGGVSPYSYSVLPNGAGGTIDSSTGIYTAPSSVSESPNQAYDVIQVTDSSASTTTSQILVGTPLTLFCDVIQTYMGLDTGRIFLFNQKIFQPSDYGLYIIVSVPHCKPFGNSTELDTTGSGVVANQYVNMYALIDLDIISRGPAALNQKELVIAALNSQYSEQQQEANSFYIGRISSNFINLSNIDGAAIPYRFKISVAMQYTVTKSVPISYYNTFPTPSLVTNA